MFHANITDGWQCEGKEREKCGKKNQVMTTQIVQLYCNCFYRLWMKRNKC